MLQYRPLRLVWNWLFILWTDMYKTESRTENTFLSCIPSLSELSWIYEWEGTVSPPRFIEEEMLTFLGDFFPLLLEILVMSWSQDWIFLVFGCAWFKLWCCIGTPGVPWLLLLLLWLTPSLWPLLQGRAVAMSYSTLHAAWFHCACTRSFDASLGTDLESSDPSLKHVDVRWCVLL